MATYDVRTRCWGQPFAVRADWAQPACEIRTLSEDGWTGSGRQVGGTTARQALREHLQAVATDGGDDPQAESVVAEIEQAVERAVEVTDQQSAWWISSKAGQDMGIFLGATADEAFAAMCADAGGTPGEWPTGTVDDWIVRPA